MNELNFDIWELIPEFSRIIQLDYSSPEGLSAWVVLILLVLSGIFVLYAINAAWKANAKLKFFRSLIEGVDKKDLVDQRRNFREKAKQYSKPHARLWIEFDESLVQPRGKPGLFNTLDAAHFFNTETIANGITNNRLLAAVPGFLTAIGVIGTFAGLQMGLSGLSGNLGEDLQIEELKSGIFVMIAGASVAFMTSVWGVLCSVVFNFIEKFIERGVKKKILDFQNTIDFLFPRITAEQSLSNIENTAKESNEHLGELAEKIGGKLQEAMAQTSKEIRSGLETSLNDILAPAIKQISDNAHEGSENALESLLEKFLDGVGSAGNSQKAMMDDAASSVNSATSGMASELTKFVGDFELQLGAMAEKNASLMSGIGDTIDKQLASQQEKDSERQSAINAQIEHGAQAQERLTSTIDDVIKTQDNNQRSIISALEELHTSFAKVAHSNAESVQSLSGAANDMKATSNQLGLLSSTLKTSSDLMSSKVLDASKIVESISEENRLIQNTFSELSEKMSVTLEKTHHVITQMDKTVDKANEGYESLSLHYMGLAEKLELHVRELDDAVGNMMRDYAEEVKTQTSNRMGQWVTETNKYTSSMVDAINSLGAVVDEIDGKVAMQRNL